VTLREEIGWGGNRILSGQVDVPVKGVAIGAHVLGRVEHEAVASTKSGREH